MVDNVSIVITVDQAIFSLSMKSLAGCCVYFQQ